MDHSLVDLLMERDMMTREESEEMVQEYRDRVLDQELSLDEALEELGVEPDYAFDLLGV